MKKLGWLAAGTLLLWIILIYPGWLLFGDVVWIHSLSALAICLVPALATMAWTLKTSNAPESQLVAVLGGSGIRMAFALGVGLLLYKTLPETFTDYFWLWIGLFYMFILAVETILVIKNKQDSLA
jgi:hypothetical protein